MIKNKHPSRFLERGNVFFTLFGAVAVVGVLGAGIMSTMRGPLSTMVEVNRRTQAESEMQIVAKIALLETVNTVGTGGNCDSDQFLEPIEYADPGAGESAPTGGGVLPASLGATNIDPWGTNYGYCSWDAGSDVKVSGCGGASANRLAGNGDNNDSGYVVIAVVSAGADKTFDTACVGGSNPSISKTAGTDDFFETYTYDAAVANTGGLWRVNSADSSVAEIDKDLDVTGSSSFSGAGVFGGLLSSATGLDLPQTGSTVCNAANEGILARTDNPSPASDDLEICTDLGGGSFDFVVIAGPSLGATWNYVSGLAGDIYYDTGNVGVGMDTPARALDVTGTFGATGDVDLGAALNLTGAADFDSTLDVAGATTLSTLGTSGLATLDSASVTNTLGVGGATTLSSTLDVTGAVSLSNSLDVDGTATMIGNVVMGDANTDTVSILGPTTIGETLDVQGAVSDSTGNLTLDDAVDITGAADIGGTLDVTGTTNVGTFNASGNVDLNGTTDINAGDSSGTFSHILVQNGDDTVLTATTSEIQDAVEGSGLDADTLDDVDSLQFLRSDEDDTFDEDGAGLTLNIGSSATLDINSGADLDVNGDAYIDAPDVVMSSSIDYVFVREGDDQIKRADASELNSFLSSGTGLDADTLDGLDSLDFIRATADDEFEASNTLTMSGTLDLDSEIDIEGTESLMADQTTGNMFLSRAGDDNLFLGTTARSSLDTTTGTGAQFNTIIGEGAGESLTTANANVLLGYQAGQLNITGPRNIFIGARAGEQNTAGDENVFVGHNAGLGWGGGAAINSGNLLLGKRAGYVGTGTASVTGSNNVLLGTDAGGDHTAGDRNILLGWGVEKNTATDSDYLNIGNTLFGDMGNNPTTAGSGDATITVDGSLAVTGIITGEITSVSLPIDVDPAKSDTPPGVVLDINIGADNFLAFSGTNNLFVGEGAGNAVSGGAAGTDNAFLGYQAGIANTTGSNNAFIGTGAGLANTTGNLNTFVGAWAGYSNIAAADNTFIGGFAGASNDTGFSNTFVGRSAGQVVTSGASNSFLGSGTGIAVTTGQGNTLLGAAAGDQTAGGSSNTFIGFNAGDNNISGSRNIIIGTDIDNASDSTSDYLNIGNALFGAMGNTGSTSDGGADLSVDGDLTVTGDLDATLTTAIFEYVGSVVRTKDDNAPHATADFLFGSATLSGTDNRFFFDKSRGAFRAGAVDGTQWDDSNVGDYSVSLGRNTIASNGSSTAFGRDTTASGGVSTAFGDGSVASGPFSFAAGYNTTASGNTSTTLGHSTVASGVYSTAIGMGGTATGNHSIAIGSRPHTGSFAEISMGYFSDDTVGDVSNWVATDVLFEVGNGVDASNRNNAFTILKNGNTSIDGDLSVAGTITGTYGGAIWENNGGIIRTVDDNAPWASADFVFGSDTLSGTEARMFFDKSKSAFRVGNVDSTQWDDASVGNYSVSLGRNTTASGTSSTALGWGTTASASISTAMGYNSTASGYTSLAAGRQTTASGQYTTSLGYQTIASGDYSFAVGLFSESSGARSVAMGWGTEASGSASLATGNGTEATGSFSTAMGYDSVAIGNNSTATGYMTHAGSFSETSMGQYSDDTAGDTTNWVATDVLFEVGNGFNGSSRNNALTILKSGNTNIDGNLSVEGTITGAYEGAIFENNSGVIRTVDTNAPWASADFVFGSDRLDNNIAGTDDDNRMFFDKSKGAFRAGIATGTEWDDANVGDYSIALGQNSIASQQGSVALGNDNNASGNYSIVIGSGSTASGARSTALGRDTTASGNFSISMNRDTIASGDYSTAMGEASQASGSHSMAVGDDSTASGESSFSGGRISSASGNYSFAYGNSARALGIFSVAFGEDTEAGVEGSFVGGASSEASGDYSFAYGDSTLASGARSVSVGQNTGAYGNSSFAAGSNTHAGSLAETSFGQFSDNTPGNTSSWVATDVLFEVGNGADGSNRNNAFQILKNGNTTIDGNLIVTGTFSGAGVDADLLDGIDSLEFLRANDNDTFGDGGALTLTIGADDILDLTGSLIDSTGSVTIDDNALINGDLDLDGKLDVTNTSNEIAEFSSSTDNAVVQISEDTDSGYSMLRLGTDNSTTNAAYMIAYGSAHSNQPDELSIKNLYGDVTFYAETGGASTAEKMRLTTDGRLGIGTDTPTTSLHVLKSSATQPTAIFEQTGASPNIVLSDGTDAMRFEYNDTANEIRIQTANTDGTFGGATVATIESTGNIGIGTESPTTMLHIEHSDSGVTPSSIAGLFVENSGSNNSSFVFQTATTGGGKSFSITNAGNVGIGTDTPEATLDVVGTDAMIIPRGTSAQQPAGGSSVNGMIRYDTDLDMFQAYQGGAWQDILTSAIGNAASLVSDQDGDTLIQVEESADDDTIRFDTDGTERMVITPTGSVGIGISPTNKLHVDDSIRIDGDINMRTGALVVQAADGSTHGSIAGTGTKLMIGDGVDDLVIDRSSGSVGIGTDTPTSPLEVAGIGLVSRFGNGLISDDSYLATNGRAWFGYDGTSGNAVVQGVGGKGIEFNVDNGTFGDGTAMMIESNGNVGIGTATPRGLLELSYGSNYGFIGSENNMHVYSNAYYDGSGWHSMKGGEPARIIQTYEGDNAALSVRVDTSVSAADESLTWQDLFIVKDSGEVGIGTTTPASKLAIADSQTTTTLANDATLTLANTDATANNHTSVAFGFNATNSNSYARIGAINVDRTGGSETQDLYFGTLEAGSFAERMRIDSAGNVGIGTTDPQGTLHLSGAGTDTPQLRMTNTGGGSTWTMSQRTTGVNFAENAVADGRLFLENGGNVGIGTTNPRATLDIQGTDAMIIPSGTTAQQPAGGSSVNGMIRYDTTLDMFQAYQGGAWQDILTSATGNSATELTDSDGDTLVQVEEGEDDDTIRFDTAGTERMVLDSAGNLNLDYRLWIDSDGDGGDTVNVFSVGGSDISTDNVFTVQRGGNVGIGTAVPNEQLEVTGNTVVRSPENNGAFILSPGNAGYGTDPEFVIQSAETTSGTDANFHISRNAIFQTSDDTYQYIDNGGAVATSIEFDNNGDVLFKSAASGTGEITWENNVFIEGATGNMGIGTTSPSDRLTIAGSLGGDGLTLDSVNGAGINIDRAANTNHYRIDFMTDGTEEWVLGNAGEGNGNLYLYEDGTSTARVTIEEGGQVGIGTASPSTRLHVLSDGFTGQTIQRSGASGGITSQFLNADGSSWNLGVGSGATGNFGIYKTAESFGSQFMILDNGNVGLNTTSPDAPLHINVANVGVASNVASLIVENADAHIDMISSDDATWGSSIDMIEGAGASNTDAWTMVRQTTGGTGDSSLHFKFGTDNTTQNNTSHVVFEAGGNVGIGTDAPQATLDVVGTDAMIIPRGTSAQQPAGGSSVNGMIRYDTDLDLFQAYQGGAWQDILTSAVGNVATIVSDEDEDTLVQVEEGTDDDTIRFDTAGTERMVILPNGNVGIGTASPSQALEVNGSLIATAINSTSGLYKGGDNDDAIRFGAAEALTEFEARGHIRIDIDSNDNATDRYLDITHNGGSSLMRVQEDGNVGIGVTSPASLLHIGGSGNGQAELKITDSANPGMELRSTGTDATMFIDFADESTAETANGTPDYDGRIAYDGTNDEMEFYTNGNERVVIKSNGRMIINSADPTSALETNGRLTVSSSEDELAIFESSDAVSSILIRQTDSASFSRMQYGTDNGDDAAYFIAYGSTHPNQADEFSMKNQVGALSFFAGGNTDPNKHMILNTSGRLALGDSSSTGNYLHVTGSNAENTYDVLIGARKYPRITLNDTYSGGANHQIWNIGSQLRFGTSASNASNAAFVINPGTGSASSAYFTGKLGVGTASPSTALEVDGTVTATAFVGDGSGLDGIVADDAELLDSFDSAQFLRADADDTYGDGGARTLTIGADDTLDVTGSIIDSTGSVTVADHLLVSQASDVAEVRVESGDILLDATTAAENSGDLIFRDSANAQIGRIWSDEPGGELRLSGTDTAADLFVSDGAVDVAGNLTVSAGTSGDAILRIEADTDDNGEGDNPKLIFAQDGGLLASGIGHGLGVTGEVNQNALYIANSIASGAGIGFATGNTTGYSNATTAMFINPDQSIDFSGSLLDSSGILTVGDDLEITGTLDVQGNVSDSVGDFVIDDNLIVTGSIDARGTISDSTGNVTIGDAVDISGTATVNNSLIVNATGVEYLQYNRENTPVTIAADGYGNSSILAFNANLVGFAGSSHVDDESNWTNADDSSNGNRAGALSYRANGGRFLFHVGDQSTGTGSAITWNTPLILEHDTATFDTAVIADSFTGDGSGLSGVNAENVIFELNSGVVRNSGNNATEDFVFGSPTLNYSSEAERFYFDKSRAAFRAGYADGTSGDDINTGNYSAAFGYNSESPGAASFAAGQDSVAWGLGSIAQGISADAWSYGEISLGIWPDDTEGTGASAVATDVLFEVGNGTGAGARNNAFQILKNGNTTIDGDLNLTSGHVFTGDGSGLTGIQADDADTLDTFHASDFLRSTANSTMGDYAITSGGGSSIGWGSGGIGNESDDITINVADDGELEIHTDGSSAISVSSGGVNFAKNATASQSFTVTGQATVNNQLRIDRGTTTIGGATAANSWLWLSDDGTTGLGLDPNEVYGLQQPLNIGTTGASNAIRFLPNASPTMRLTTTGLNIGSDDSATGLMTLRNATGGVDFDVSGVNGDLIMSSTLSDGDIRIDPQANLQLGTASSDVVIIGRTNDNKGLQTHGRFVHNEDGNTMEDFRIESDTQDHMFFVDASANAIGIGNSTPTTALDVTGTVTATAFIGDGSGLDGITADSADDLICTDCIGPTEITDSYVLNTGDTVSGDLAITGTLEVGSVTASGSNSVAFGNNTTASGSRSAAFGNGSTASGGGAMAFGVNTQAVGNYSVAFGSNTHAGSNQEVSFGAYSENTAGAIGGWVPTEVLFEIGNGADSSNRNNAFQILKNGNTTIDGDLTLTSGHVFTGDGSGLTGVNADNVVFELNGGLVRNTGAHASEDFVFGSTQLADTGNANHDARFFFDKSKGAFRAGQVIDTEWDDANVGNRSFAAGLRTIASANDSVAMGRETVASGWYSFAAGHQSTASGLASFAFGSGVDAAQSYAVALGQDTTASGSQSFAANAYTTASGTNSVALGNSTTAAGVYSFAMGNDTHAGSLAEISLGRYSDDTAGSPSSWVATDILFEIGNGGNDASRNNAFQVLKSGNTTIDGDLTLTSGHVFTGDGSGLSGIDIDLSDVTGTLGIAQGGTGATTAAGALSNLGAVDITGDTMTGPLSIDAGTGDVLDLNNGSIVGINHITINDPGEGFRFYGGSSGTKKLIVVDDATDNIVRLHADHANDHVFDLRNDTGDFDLYADGDIQADDNLQGNRLIIDVATGTAPMTINSTTKVTNLNADLLDDLSSASFARKDTSNVSGAIHNNHIVVNYADSSNVDHIWHDETNNVWNFISDAALEGTTSNSTVKAGAFEGDGSNLTGIDADTVDGMEANEFVAVSGDQMTGSLQLSASSDSDRFQLTRGSDNLYIQSTDLGSNTTAFDFIIRDDAADVMRIRHFLNASTYQNIATFGRSAITLSQATTVNADLTIAGGSTISGDGSGLTGVDADNVVFELNSGVVRNTGAHASEDFVFGSTQLADTGDSNHDARMFFDKSKSAFRAGNTLGTEWDDTNVGLYSFATGRNNIASGQRSVAMGYGSVASETSSFAFGDNATASGTRSMAFGSNATASSPESIALGFTTTASGNSSFAVNSFSEAVGNHSFAAGNFTHAGSFAETSFGRYSESTAGNPTSWSSTDVLFEIGNGSGTGSRNNALTILKNGNTTIDGSLTLAGGNGLSVSGGIDMNSTNITELGNLSSVNFIDMVGDIDMNGNDITAGGTISANVLSSSSMSTTNFSCTNCIGSSQLADSFTVSSIDYSSDERKKDNIETLTNALEKVTQIRGVSYIWKDEWANDNNRDETQVGLIAQEVEAVYPELVNTDEDGYKSVKYAQLIGPVIEAIKELWIFVQDISDKIATLFDRDTELQAQIDLLKSQNEQLIKRLEALETKSTAPATP